MVDRERNLFVIKGDFLPEVFRKTIQVKELLTRGEARTVQEAVNIVGLSRSAFYKYKDSIFPFSEAAHGRIITLSFLLEHRPGILSKVLNSIAAAGGNILTINQSLPIQGVANVTLTIETSNMHGDIEEMFKSLRGISGVKKVELIAQD